MDSSSEDFEDLNCIEEGDLDTLDDISDGEPKKPHFLDYDATPPTGEELQFSCYSSLPETSHPLPHANDLDKNNANEKSAAAEAIINVPSNEGGGGGGRDDDVLQQSSSSTNRILLTRRRSATEVVPPTVSTSATQQNTGTRKKEFSASGYHSLDYDPEPVMSRGGDKRSSSTTNRHIAAIDGGVSHRRPMTTAGTATNPMSTSMSSYLEHGNGVSLRNQHQHPSNGSTSGGVGGGGTWPDTHSKHNPARRTVHEMGPKVECVYSLLSMLGSRDIKVTSGKFLELSKSPETCTTLRRSGCIPLFVQMIHSDSDEVSRKNAAQALHNVVHCHPDDKVGRRESKVLKLIETVMSYSEYLKRDMHKSLGITGSSSSSGVPVVDDLQSPTTATAGAPVSSSDRHPSQAIFSLMKISFDEEHRHAMCQLGALQAIAQLVHLDHAVHGMQPKDSRCVSLRRYAGMALTNLTFGDGNNKALLCSNKEFMRALVAQLNSLADDLIQVTASVLRNLSWRADNNMITVLNEIGTVTALTYAAMKNNNMENTLKAILSALWNLSAHCSANKAEFCRVAGALAFLVEMLSYDAPSKTLTIVENAGGILRNVSSHIAVREDYRQVLRERDCLGILLQQLRSESLTIVSNACGTLWNLSARCPTDQKYLWENGAVPMLRSLIHSKHKMISNGSNAALKNLLNYRPGNINHVPLDSVTKAMNLKELPSLSIRKQRALEAELDRKLSDTCEIIDMAMSPKREKEVAAAAAAERRTGANLMHNQSESVEEEEEEERVSEETRQTSTNGVDIKQSQEDDSEDPSDHREEDAPVSMNVAPPASMGESRPQQETEFDQITDYSLRYEQEEEEDEEASDQFNGNEIILILEDTVKCYEEEGTPYTISNATSMTDLRRESNERRVKVDPPKQPQQRKSLTQQATNSGLQTPEKPYKYAEEGTPGCFSTEFSRIGSLSSLEGDNSPPRGDANNGPVDKEKKSSAEEAQSETKGEDESSQINPQPTLDQDENSEKNKTPVTVESQPTVTGSDSTTPPPPPVVEEPVTSAQVTKAAAGESASAAAASKSVSFIDYAQETPLMFSRTSSLESLSSAEPACVDDVSSVVSEFSRVASGIMSPSELPDSPTQSVPQSPSRRRRQQQQQQQNQMNMSKGGVRQSGVGQVAGGGAAADQPQSVFEDKMDMFDVENTPAQFSCATSLSNLSFLNDDQGGAEAGTVSGPGTKEEEEENHSPKEPTTGQSSALPKIPDNESDDDDDGDEGDDELLDTCVNMGLNRRTKGELNPDFMRQYYTEDTPAHLSKACSNSDLSVLSMLDNVNQCEVVHDDSSRSSSSSDAGNDDDNEKLLQECIANGIENTISKAVAETQPPPMLPDKPKPVASFQQRPQQERRDSLSSLSIDSGDDGDILEQAIAAGLNRVAARKPEFIVGASASATTTTGGRNAPVNDSMSSLDSCESNEQSNLLFEQCMQSGLEKRSGSAAGSTSTLAAATAPPPLPRTQKSRTTGQIPVRGQQQQAQKPRVAPRNVEYHKTDDEALLMECINMGIEKNVSKGVVTPAPQPVATAAQSRYEYRENINSENILARQNQDIMRRIERMTLEEKFGQSPKNVNGASVATQESCAGAVQEEERITGDGKQAAVEESNCRPKCPNEGTTDAPRNGVQGEEQESNNKELQAVEVEVAQVECTTQPRETRPLEGIINSINGFDDGQALEQSNEYPALKSSSATEQSLMMMTGSGKSAGGGGGVLESKSGQMNASNEYMVDSVNRREALSTSTGGSGEAMVEKHKDPDLMLESVDRLTHVLVTTAEYLRAHDVSAASELEAKRRMEGSCDGSTWNDNTCPNGDVSFPSLSFSPPKIEEEEEEGKKVEMDDDFDENTITESLSLNKITEPAAMPGAMIGMDEMRGSVTAAAAVSLSQKSRKLSSGSGGGEQKNVKMDQVDAPPPPAIRFEIGGEVNNTSLTAIDPFKFSGSIASLDLDDIQPPSEMEGVSYNNYNGVPMHGSAKLTDSPQMSSLRNRKGLSSTLVARRAIAGHTSITTTLMKSVDSIASHTNLENIAPPSLMDELLDSMMSVDSITSEVASDPLARTLCGSQMVEMSNYETALSDNEDTMTLRSCRDLPMDGNGSSSNCSSNQSTPVRKRRPGSITPKMKREMARERFKTYTVDSMELKQQQQQQPAKKEKVEEERSQVVPTTSNGETPSPEKSGGVLRVSAKQRRQENRSRFQTQILDYSEMKIFEIAPKEGEEPQQQQSLQEELENALDVEMIEEEQFPPEPEEVFVAEKKAPSSGIKKTLLRLIKPVGVTAPETPQDTNKSVRGRRKPEYVSPYRRPTSTPTPASPVVVKAERKSLIAAPGQRKSLPATGLISKLKQVATKKSPTKVVAVTAAAKEEEVKKKELNRQGTFTKEEPSSGNLPKVNSLPTTPTKRLSKLPLVGNGGGGGASSVRKSYAGAAGATTPVPSGPVKNGGVIKRQISAPANTLGEKRKSMIASPYSASKSSSGQLSERSTSTASIKSNVSATGKTPGKGSERKLPLSMPASRSNSTMGTPRTPTTPCSASKISSLYGRAKGLIPVTSSAKK